MNGHDAIRAQEKRRNTRKTWFDDWLSQGGIGPLIVPDTRLAAAAAAR